MSENLNAPLDNSIGQLTRMAYRTFQRCLHLEIANVRLKNAHWTFLRALSTDEGQTQRTLAKQVRMLEPATTSILKAMEENGLIERRRSDADRRKSLIFLTPHGRTTRDAAVPLALNVNHHAIGDIDDSRIDEFRDVLTTMIHNLEAAYNMVPQKKAVDNV